MKANELLAMLKTAEQLGITDVPIMISESRDGEMPEYTEVSAYFEVIRTSSNGEDNVVLVVG